MCIRDRHYSALLTQYQKADEIPFDYARKFISTLVRDIDGECQLIMKGDIGHIVSRCSHVEYRGEILPIEKDDMQSVSSVVDDMLQEGMKVIAIAVSYTHRDVYKRQKSGKQMTKNKFKITLCIVNSGKAVLPTKSFMGAT